MPAPRPASASRAFAKTCRQWLIREVAAVADMVLFHRLM